MLRGADRRARVDRGWEYETFANVLGLCVVPAGRRGDWRQGGSGVHARRDAGWRRLSHRLRRHLLDRRSQCVFARRRGKPCAGGRIRFSWRQYLQGAGVGTPDPQARSRHHSIETSGVRVCLRFCIPGRRHALRRAGIDRRAQGVVRGRAPDGRRSRGGGGPADHGRCDRLHRRDGRRSGSARSRAVLRQQRHALPLGQRDGQIPGQHTRGGRACRRGRGDVADRAVAVAAPAADERGSC